MSSKIRTYLLLLFIVASTLAAGAAAWDPEKPAVGIGAGAAAATAVLLGYVGVDRFQKNRARKRGTAKS